ncbi:putative RNA-binding protein [Trypanosoma grayi]|uniref:putative RNA-binding protein n=1 Tax=Trypanosoma grayi TaxID=71804 RepID=UPI0004F496E9|nr:putative RNA-binding protein [Trypanosoma grayi]KEG07011.1 putative RNA-binding protein [Trypanosoma grayi]
MSYRGSGGGQRRQRSPSPDSHHHHHHSRPYQSGNNYNYYREKQQQRQNSPPRRPPYRRRREDVPYNIPSAAPRLRVPCDLPVDVTAFLDLVAFYVVQGGPTTEEEIMKREENNTHFAFLHAPWRDPMQLYYRWRLYSLLQGDTLLKWRTEPYQIERGNDAYVWVPPPAIHSGPECLLDAFKPSTSSSVRDGLSQGTVGEDAATAAAQQPVPSASWLSRMSVSEGSFFVTLERAAVEEWKQLLQMESHLADVVEGCGGGVEQSLENRLSKLGTLLLDRELIARRMVFAVEHQKAALHVLSLVLDEIVRLAYEAATPVGGAGSQNSTCRSNKNNSSGTKGSSGEASDSNNKNSRSNDNSALRAASRCFMCLSHLFTLNDIGKNGGAPPLTEEEVASLAPSWEERGGPNNNNSSSSGSHPIAPAAASVSGLEAPHAVISGLLPLPSPSPSNPYSSAGTGAAPAASVVPVRMLNRALEKIMPTLIEATLVVALCTVQQYGALEVDNARETARSSAKPPGAEEFEGILPLDIDQAAYVHVQAKLSSPQASAPSTVASATAVKKEDRDAVCMIAMLLISWLKQLCASWADGDVIGSRCWSTLVTKYVYLLSQPVETT